MCASCLSRTAESTVVDLAPVDPDLAPAADPAGEAAEPACSRTPVARPDEDRNDLGCFSGPAFDRDVVDVATPAPVPVEDLVVDHVQPDVELRTSQFWPAFVRIMSGIAVNATITITTR